MQPSWTDGLPSSRRRHPRPPAAALLLGLSGCSAATTGGPLGQAALMRTVTALADPALAGRAAGTPGERAAADHVVRELRRIGLDPQLQDVPEAASTNVYALLPGASDELIVIGAHLDHLGVRGGAMYRGADDDASGIAALLGIAESLVARRGELGRSVLVVAFGAEELGMVGSGYFVEHPPVDLARVTAMVNIDMIGRPLQDRLLFRPALHLFGVARHRAVGIVGVRSHLPLRRIADAAFAAWGGEVVAPEDWPDVIGDEIERAARGRSDSASFEAHAIPALFFGDGESSDYHQPGDTPDQLDRELLEQRAHAIADVVVALSTAPAEAFVATTAPPPKRLPGRGWYLPFGFSNAWRWPGGYVLGGEASLVHFSPGSNIYAGVYGDALYRGGAWRYSVGPEFGKGLFGVDAGYVAEGGRRGYAVRPFVTASVLSIGVRAGYLEGWFGELAVLVKYPLGL